MRRPTVFEWRGVLRCGGGPGRVRLNLARHTPKVHVSDRAHELIAAIARAHNLTMREAADLVLADLPRARTRRSDKVRHA